MEHMKMEGELSLYEQKKEEYDNLQMKIVAAETDEERKKLEEESNKVEQELADLEGRNAA
jgi:hypothetical protein